MSSDLLIESDRHQTRIALREEGRAVEIDLERPDTRSLVGNIYWGRVSRVLPGIQAAFVDIGLERGAFLFVGDVEDGLAEVSSLELDRAEPARRSNGATDDRRSIQELVRKGQELLVQVTKDPLPNKGVRVTTQISLPGRLLVLLPRTSVFGVSRRITDPEERQRLLGLLQELVPTPGGAIARTAGAGRGRTAMRRELNHLTDLWNGLRRVTEGASAPALVHLELDLELRSVRDLLADSVEAIRVSGAEAYQRIDAYLAEIDPGLRGMLCLYDETPGLFESCGVEREIESALRRKVWLKSGGYIVVTPTEALATIDVNTGRFVGTESLEETVVQTNLEAAQEVVRQMRLRNLGGIVVVDFIDMADLENRRRVIEALERELQEDRARSRVLGISEFGLVEITRKRSRPSLERLLTQSCPCCRGRGRIRSAAATVLEVRRQVQQRCSRHEGRRIRLQLHPETLRTIEAEQRPVLEELEGTLAIRFLMEGNPAIHPGEFEIVEEDAVEGSDPGLPTPPRTGSG